MAVKTRSGIPTVATIITAGVPGTSPQVRDFGKAYVRPMLITNKHATEVLHVSVNGIVSSATAFMWKLAAGEALDPTFRGIVNIQQISLYYASVAYTNAATLGWRP